MATAALPSPTFQKRSRQILVAGFVGSFFSVGFSIYLFGVFQNAMLESFGASVAPSLSRPAYLPQYRARYRPS